MAIYIEGEAVMYSASADISAFPAGFSFTFHEFSRGASENP